MELGGEGVAMKTGRLPSRYWSRGAGFLKYGVDCSREIDRGGFSTRARCDSTSA